MKLSFAGIKQAMKTETQKLIFICARNADYQYAEAVYHFLVAAGLPVFFSQESLPELGISDYRKQIDQALDEAEHMIVITSSVENALSSWVEAEWGFFINEKRSGRKTGNLITVAVGGLKPVSLPPSLRYYEVIPYDPAGLDKVLRYVQSTVKRNMRASSRDAAVQPISNFREVATFGGPPGTGTMAIAGPLLATGGNAGAVRIWDTKTHRRLMVLASDLFWRVHHEGMITALAFSADAVYLASGHIDGAVHVWTIGDEKEIGVPLLKHEDAIAGLSFSPDSRTLASCGKDGYLKLWNMEELTQKQGRPRIHHKPAPLLGLAYVQEGQKLVCSLADRETGRHQLQIHETTGSHPLLATLNVPDFLSALAVSPDSRILAGGSPNGSIFLFDLVQLLEELDARENPRGLTVLKHPTGHRKNISSLSFLPTGSELASAAMEPRLVIWDVNSGKEIARLTCRPEEAYASAAYFNEGLQLIAALRDGRIRMWER
jgi:hypothetical protein